MVAVPAGEFVMGSSDEKRAEITREFGDFFAKEGPLHTVTIAQPFAVGVYAVTWSEFEACIAAGACDGAAVERTGGDNGWGKGRRPIIEVSWLEAQSYVRWLSRKTGFEYRLLSETEWEYAARAGSSADYSWGDDIGVGQANCSGCGSRWDDRGTAPVGSFAPNAFGLHDMHGNVREWVEDCWSESHEAMPHDGTPVSRPDCQLRVVRGGAWNLHPVFVRSAARDCYQPTDQLNNVGFRVARTLLAK